MSAPLLLEYGGPRPVFAVQPWRHDSMMHYGWAPSPLIEPLNRRSGAFVDVYRAHREGWSEDVPLAFRFSPFVQVCTAPVRAWKKGRDDQYTSRFFVRGRFSFEAAYRAARMIAAGRAVRTAVDWEMWRFGLHADIAPAHRRLVSFDLAQARDWVPSECRVCGCTDERACECGCHWDQPDLCSACVGREKHGPCGGSVGWCDWCGRRSQRLQISVTSLLSACPRCCEADRKEGRQDA